MQRYHVAVPLLDEPDGEARRLGHSSVAPEHMLIAVVANATGRSRGFLDRVGLKAPASRAANSV